jgi:hypothetical protein
VFSYGALCFALRLHSLLLWMSPTPRLKHFRFAVVPGHPIRKRCPEH